MDPRSTRTRGIALIESLFYVAILVLLVSAAVSTLIALNTSYGNIRSAESIGSSARIALDRIVKEVRLASSIDASNSAFATSTGRLSLMTTDASGAPATIEFFLSTSTRAVRVKENGVDTGRLTADSARATSFALRQIQTPVSEGVRIELELSSGYGTRTRSETFYATSVLRNSYPHD